MLTRPRVTPCFGVVSVEREGVLLLSEKNNVALRGRLYESLVPLMDGQRSIGEIVDLLDGTLSPEEVWFGVSQLEAKGYVVDGDDEGVATPEAVFWSLQGVAPGQAVSRLASTPVALVEIGVDGSSFRQLAESMRLRLSESAPFTVVLVDDYLNPALADRNRRQREQQRPWLLAKPVGAELWLGPLFVPGMTACWECLAARLRSNRRVDSFVGQVTGEAPRRPVAGTLPGAAVASALIAGILLQWMARDEVPELLGTIVTFDLTALRTTMHKVIRLDRCAACGEGPSADRSPTPVILQSRRIVHGEDAGWRTVSADATWDAYAHHVSPLSGVLSGLWRCRDDAGLHVYVAEHDFAAPARTMDALAMGTRSNCSGKGTTDRQARVSALCEALERHSGELRGGEHRLRARLVELPGAIHPNLCMLFSESQYRTRDTWNARCGRFNRVPRRFDPETAIDWTPVWSMTANAVRYLPTSLCYFAPDERHEGFCVNCSNGNAAGNTLEEAILQGVLELVERDAVAVWWYNQLSRPAVSLESFGLPYLERTGRYLRDRSRTLTAFDLTADLGIPVFAAVSRRLDQSAEEIMVGFGAHLDARIALLRAVTELIQMWQFFDGHADRLVRLGMRPEADEIRAWLEQVTVRTQPQLVERLDQRTADDFACAPCDDIAAAVRTCQDKIERAGLELLVLDQTRSDVGLPVCKVIVPGLRHFWARFAAGRLYTVPVQLGWMSAPRAELELNPVPIIV